MKRFYGKFIVAILSLSVIIGCIDYMSMQETWRQIIAKWTNSEEYITVNVGSSEIIPYIEELRVNNDTKAVILGDSVCKQMFDGLQKYNPDFCMMGSNAAIAMSGQYILAVEYLNNHPTATDMYLYVLPNSLLSTFDTGWGYQYTVMPFVLTDTINLLEADTIKDMESVYGSKFMEKKVVECIDKSALNRKIYLNLLAEHGTTYQQNSPFELADKYIKKIYDLCNEKGVQLHLSPCPVVESRKEAMESLSKEYEKTWLYTVFPDYFHEILYYPDIEARDGVHFGGEYATQEQYNIKIKEMIAGKKLADELKFE